MNQEVENIYHKIECLKIAIDFCKTPNGNTVPTTRQVVDVANQFYDYLKVDKDSD